jgi:hypothetical protein
MYIPKQELIGNATYSEMLEAADILAEKQGDRWAAEEEIRQALPKGHSVGIDDFGIIHIMSPLQVHKPI